ncbi:MAG TPA: sulfurtransferase FdhD, partial [Micrococcaceae bacterium]|nr:sulfurtransferase FdhD [Micrococcaceae bacterium]
MGRKILRRRIIRATLGGSSFVREEKLAGEEPLEIRFGS